MRIKCNESNYAAVLARKLSFSLSLWLSLSLSVSLIRSASHNIVHAACVHEFLSMWALERMVLCRQILAHFAVWKTITTTQITIKCILNQPDGRWRSTPRQNARARERAHPESAIKLSWTERSWSWAESRRRQEILKYCLLHNYISR